MTVRDGPGSTTENASDRAGVQVISRAVAILRCLEGEADGLSLGDLATRLGLARSTVQRIVRALSDERMLMPAGPSGGVKFGPLLVRLAGNAAIDVVPVVRPIIEHLSHTLQETVDLSILQGQAALFIDQVVGSRRLGAVSRIGDAFPLHSTASGKSLLAAGGLTGMSRPLPRILPADTPNTITDRARLEAELATVVESGIAFDREEHTVGVSAVGTWFFDPTGKPYAVSVPVPSVRFENGAAMIGPLRAARSAIERALGTDTPRKGSRKGA